jgi:hypothetical protein
MFGAPILQPSQICEAFMTKHLVVVAGNIGVGKTSLTERIGSRLGWWTGYESVADNPYLADFYTDMRTWAFHLQVFFLGHRADQYLAAARDARSSILDRSIYEDCYIFARALHHMGDLSERDYLAYRRLFDLVVGSVPRPNLLIYLKAPVKVLMDRIRRRADMKLALRRNICPCSILSTTSGWARSTCARSSRSGRMTWIMSISRSISIRWSNVFKANSRGRKLWSFRREISYPCSTFRVKNI